MNLPSTAARHLSFATLALAILLLGRPALAEQSVAPPERTDADAVRLTGDAGHDRWPAWSPDGRHIAFASDRNGSLDIYVMKADGSDVRRLTDDPLEEFDPSWSPDGRQIVFTSSRNASKPRNRRWWLSIMNADGSARSRLYQDSRQAHVSDNSPSFSPDGRGFVFNSRRSGLPDLYIMDADGSSVTKPLGRDRDRRAPSWSPDGRRLAFTGSDRRGYGDDAVYVLDLEGGRVERLSERRSVYFEPAWSPDGEWIAYIGYADDGPALSHIYAVRPDGTGETILVRATPERFGQRLEAPAWSPDGTRIAFDAIMRGEPNAGIYVVDLRD